MESEIITALGGQQAFGTRAMNIDLIEEVERGLPIKAYRLLSKTLQLNAQEETKLLRTSERTRARWKHRARLDPATSDRLVRVARVFALAIDVLESETHAAEWLREKNAALRGKTPLEAIATDPGAELVTNILYQMEYGVYA
jgi:putative toxin-antitoxin system antitoxin component (TIGR02293 family)